MNRLRLLIVTPELAPTFGGGIVTFYRELLPALREQGIEISALVGSGFHQPGGAWTVDGIRAEGLCPDRFSRFLRRFAHWSAVPELQRHLAASAALFEQANTMGEFDVIEVADWGLLGAQWLAGSHASRTIVQMHGSAGQIATNDPQPGAFAFEEQIRLLERALFARAGAVWAHSQTNVKDWTQRCNIPVQYMPSAFQTRQSSAEHGEGYVVFARVQRWKGPETLCEALRLCASADRVDWFGRSVPDPVTGEEMGDSLLRRFPDVWGVGIVPHATLPPNEVMQKMNTARAVLVPSSWDVFNFTVVEAMAQGALVIASSGAGASSLIRDGESGWVFESGNAFELAQCLEKAQSATRTQRVKMGAAARRTIELELDPNKVAAQRAKAYRALATTQTIVGDQDMALSECVAPRDAGDASWRFLSRYPARRMADEILLRLKSKLGLGL